jgi:hypothetical protein
MVHYKSPPSKNITQHISHFKYEWMNEWMGEWVGVCACVCMYVCMYVCIYVFMYLCIYVCMYLCMYVCMYVRVCVCVCVCVPLPGNTQHSKQTKVHAPVGFELTTPADELPQMYALDRAVTGTCNMHVTCGIIYASYRMPSMLKIYVKGSLIDCGLPSHMCNVWRIFLWKENKKSTTF